MGTVLVKEVLSAQSGKTGASPGAAFSVFVMRKVGKAAGATDGWSFEAYNTATKKRDTSVDTTGCYVCHMKKADNDFVFSRIPVNPAAQIK